MTILAIGIAFVLTVHSVFSQCQPAFPQQVPGVIIPNPNGEDIFIPGTEIFPRWSFSLQYEGKIRTDFIVTNIQHNGKPIPLKGWCYDQTLRGTPEAISDRSRTESFYVHRGDKISFFREILWWNFYDDPLTYYADDPWEFTVELRDSETDRLLATLDRCTIAAQQQPGYPNLQLEHPPAAVIEYQISEAIADREVYIQCRIASDGNTAIPVFRFDKFGIRFPKMRIHDDPSALLMAWKLGNWPPRSRNTNFFVSYQQGMLSIAADIPASTLQLRIYTLEGRNILTRTVKPGDTIAFVPEKSGSYQVELYEGDRLISHALIPIAR